MTCCLYSAKNIIPEIVKQIFLSCVYMMCKIQGLKYPLIFSFLFFKSKILTCCLYWWQTDEILSRRDLNSPILLFLLLFIFCNLLNFVVSGLSSVNYCQNMDPFSFFLQRIGSDRASLDGLTRFLFIFSLLGRIWIISIRIRNPWVGTTNKSIN